MKKKIKVAAVLSTAAFLSMCAPLISFASQGWTQENGGWAYYNANGERVTETGSKRGTTGIGWMKTALWQTTDCGRSKITITISEKTALWSAVSGSVFPMKQWKHM